MFHEKCKSSIFFVEANNNAAISLICNESVAVLNEFGLHRHYEIKHLIQNLSGRDTLWKIFYSMKCELQRVPKKLHSAIY